MPLLVQNSRDSSISTEAIPGGTYSPKAGFGDRRKYRSIYERECLICLTDVA
jgi:hypothetical protein